jgi:hypothetical protein
VHLYKKGVYAVFNLVVTISLRNCTLCPLLYARPVRRNFAMAHNNHDIKRSDDDLNRHTSHISYDRTDGGALSKTVTIDAELFERLYLGPKTQVSGDLRSTFANPTPVALLGFSVGLLPITAAYMGWRGAGAGGANAAATTAA